MTAPTPSPAPSRASCTEARVLLLRAIPAAGLAGAGVVVTRHLAALLPAVGPEAVLVLFQLALAVLITVIAAYLTLVWTLAAAALTLGTDRGLGRAVLGALRVIAPSTARRIVLGAATATVLGSMAGAPALAVPSAPPVSPLSAVGISAPELPRPAAAASTRWSASIAETDAGSRLSSTTLSGRIAHELGEAPQERSPEQGRDTETPQATQTPQGAEETTATEDAEGSAPPIGWTTPDPAEDTAAGPVTPAASPPKQGHESTHSTAPPEQAPVIIVVRRGDTLWQIAEHALGPGADDPAAVARAVHRIHTRNLDEIGPDPDHIEPGQRLVLPQDLMEEHR